MLLVVAIFFLGMVGYLDLRRAPAGAYEVSVTAQKWTWSFDHPEFGVNEGGVLTVPLGRPVELLMTSADVLHSLFVPAFRVKQDVVRGRYSRLWFEATKPGVYQLFCAEYCGRDHSKMLALVNVLPEDEFQAAMGKLATEYMDLPEQDLPTYALDRIYNRCKSCHSLDGSTIVGPSFQGLWKRTKDGTTVFNDGRKLSDLLGPGKEFEHPEDYIRNSILDPQHLIVQNFTGTMPSFKGQLKERQVHAAVLMLKYFDRIVDSDGNRIEAPDLNEMDDGGDTDPLTSDAEHGADAQAGTDNGELK
jgi:cytochrome c oxidase subunit 2